MASQGMRRPASVRMNMMGFRTSGRASHFAIVFGLQFGRGGDNRIPALDVALGVEAEPCLMPHSCAADSTAKYLFTAVTDVHRIWGALPSSNVSLTALSYPQTY